MLSPFAHRWPVTAMMMLLGLIGLGGCQTAQHGDYDALWAQNQELQAMYNQNQSALDATVADADALRAENARLREQLAARPATPPPAARPAPARANTAFDGIAGVETVQGPGTIAVRVPGDVLFGPGEATLKASSKNTLNQIAAAIKREYAGNIIRVEGYTDTDPIRKSKWKDNLELSLQRAAAVERYLQERGLDADRVYSAGFGAARPQATKEKSRRVEIVVVLQE